MKTLRIIIAILLFVYAGYLLMRILPVINKLTDFGIGVLLGALVLITAGILILRIKPRKK